MTTDRPRLKRGRVGVELALTLVPPVGALAVALVDDWLPLFVRLGLLAVAIGWATFAATVVAVPDLQDGAIVLRVGPVRRRHPADRMSALGVEGLRVTVVRRDGSHHPILTPARFVDPDGLRADLRAWATAHGVVLAAAGEADQRPT